MIKKLRTLLSHCREIDNYAWEINKIIPEHLSTLHTDLLEKLNESLDIILKMEEAEVKFQKRDEVTDGDV